MADTSRWRWLAKTLARAAATGAVLPALTSYRLRACVLGRDRALEGSTQVLALVPGLPGQYLRRAFLQHAIEYCDPSAVIEFGTILSSTATRIECDAYIGPRCHLGSTTIGAGALVAAGVHIPSGGHIHGVDDPTRDRAGVTPRDEQAVNVGAQQLCGASDVCRHDRRFERHGFEDRVGNALAVGALDVDVEGLVERGGIIDVPGQRHPSADAEGGGARQDALSLGPIAGDQQSGVPMGQLREGINQDVVTFDALETPHGTDRHGIRRQPQRVPSPCAHLRVPSERLGIDAVQ